MPKFDAATAQRFVLPFAALFTHLPSVKRPQPEPAVMFTVGRLGDARERDERAEVARTTGLTVVGLEFEAGREQEGPKDFCIQSELEDGPLTITGIDLWMNPSTRTMLLAPRGGTLCFGFDGSALFYLEGSPAADMEDGIAAARLALHEAATVLATMDPRMRPVTRPWRGKP